MKTDQIVMTKDPSVVVSIDVFEVKEGDQETMAGYALELIQNAETDPDFIVGATHRGRPAAAQPTPAPKSHAWVAIFAQWKSQGHGRAFAGMERGREILRRATSVCESAKTILDDPEASLYASAWFDTEGFNRGGKNPPPVIDSANPVAQFINIFTTTPQQQQGLINETARIIKPQVLKLDGYGAAAFYRSLDGTKVVNYGQFRSFEDIRLMFRTPSILFAFVRVLFKNVTPPLFNMLGFKIGRGPKLRTYTVESIYRR